MVELYRFLTGLEWYWWILIGLGAFAATYIGLCIVEKIAEEYGDLPLQ